MYLYRCDRCKVDMPDIDDVNVVRMQVREGHLCDKCYEEFFRWMGWSK